MSTELVSSVGAGSSKSEKRAYSAPEVVWVPVGATAAGTKNTILDYNDPVNGVDYGPGWSGS